MGWWIDQLKVRQRRDPRTLDAKGTNLVKMIAVQMGVDPEKPSEDRSDCISKVL